MQQSFQCFVFLILAVQHVSFSPGHRIQEAYLQVKCISIIMCNPVATEMFPM